MASHARDHDPKTDISSECSESDVPIVRWKMSRRRRQQILVKKLEATLIIKAPNDEVGEEAKPPPDADMSIVNYGQNQASDDTSSPPGLEPSAANLWDESSFNLEYPRLVNPRPVEYAWTTQQQDATTGDPGDKHAPLQCLLPVPPADDITKTIFLHPARPGLRWGGRWAAAKLAREVEKYERVKEFWLFEHDHGFLAGYDDKHAFVAAVFARELGSPWVVGWLRELLGEADVGRVLAALERLGGAGVAGGA